MKKLLFIFILAFSFTQIVSENYSTEIKRIQVNTDTLKVDGIDPVCKMKVKAGNTRTVVYKKATYGFCSESCKKSFEANPKNIIKNKLS